ncbi:hypothetical protein SAMN05216311_114257 [Chitinophaga sp. CF418]|nr:hypothetical protein SAMN05216311_114257 [Chitinophaga sp. CF418]
MIEILNRFLIIYRSKTAEFLFHNAIFFILILNISKREEIIS